MTDNIKKSEITKGDVLSILRLLEVHAPKTADKFRRDLERTEWTPAHTLRRILLSLLNHKNNLKTDLL